MVSNERRKNDFDHVGQELLAAILPLLPASSLTLLSGPLPATLTAHHAVIFDHKALVLQNLIVIRGFIHKGGHREHLIFSQEFF